MVRSSEPMVSLGDPVTANGDRDRRVWIRRCLSSPVAEKNFTPLLNCIRPPNLLSLLSVLVPMIPPPVVLDPDRVQVVFPEPRTPSTLMINAALAVAQVSARPISVTRRLAWRSSEVAKWFH